MANLKHFPHRRTDDRGGPGRPDYLRRGRWVFGAFAIIAGAYLVAEHRAHVVGALPLLILLACPLMHLFMHGDHGAHGKHGGDGPSDAARRSRSAPDGEE